MGQTIWPPAVDKLILTPDIINHNRMLLRLQVIMSAHQNEKDTRPPVVIELSDSEDNNVQDQKDDMVLPTQDQKEDGVNKGLQVATARDTSTSPSPHDDGVEEHEHRACG
jgi:hypothetical protein